MSKYINNIPTMDLITGLIALFCLCIVLYLILSWQPKANISKLINSIPKSRTKVRKQKKQVSKDPVFNNDKLNEIMIDLTTANGDWEDSPGKMLSDVVKTVVLAILLAVVSTMFFEGMPRTVLYGLSAFVAVYPIVQRYSDKSTFKKDYINAFYTFLNYVTLYLSGGVQMKTALLEVNDLTPEKSVIKTRLEEVIANNAMAGMAGNTYIDALEDLNKGLDFVEIDGFINSARKSQERGDAIADSLLSQIDDISKTVEMQKREYITKQESLFEVLKVVLCLLPIVAAFILPIIATAFITLTTML